MARRAGTTSATGNPARGAPEAVRPSTRLRTNGRPSAGGVALLEALIASVMAAVGVTGALSAIVAAVHTAAVAGERLQALLRLEGELVALRGEAAAAGGVEPSTRQGAWPAPPQATWQLTVTEASPYLMAVTAQVTWRRGGGPRTLTLTAAAPPLPDEES